MGQAEETHDLKAANAALIAIMVGTLAMQLDSMMVNVALPHIRDDLSPGGNVAWVVTAYFVGSVSGLPLVGWLADRFGGRRPFLCSLALFAAFGLLSAAAWNVPVLIVARFLQGLFALPIIPLGMSIVMQVFPVSRRGWAVSMWGIAGVSGPALGPTIGGQIADALSWRVNFLVIAPVCAAGILLARKALPDLGEPRRDPLDVRGMLLGPAGLSTLLLGVSQGTRWGWSSPATLVALVGGLVAILVFVRLELHMPHPILRLSILAKPGFPLGIGLLGLGTAVTTSRLVFVPLQLSDVRHYSATKNGLLLAPIALAMLAGAQTGGRLSDARGPRKVTLVGAAMLVVGSGWMATWGPSTPVAALLVPMAIQAAGTGLVATSCTVLAMSRLRTEELGQGSTMRQIAQQLGSTMSAAGGAALLAARNAHGAAPGRAQSIYNVLNLTIAGCAVIGVVAAWQIPRGLAHRHAQTSTASDPAAEPAAAP